MKREGLILIFLTLLIIGFCSFINAFESGAVSCEDLMASTGKSAYTLCHENYAGQCCNQEETPVSAPASSDEYVCSHPTEGACEIINQYNQVMDAVNARIETRGNRDSDWDLYTNAMQAQTDYLNNVWLPKDLELQSQFEACLDSEATNCYDKWKAAWDVINIEEERYYLSVAQQLYSDLGGTPYSGGSGSTGTSSGGSASSEGSGLWNQNENRGRDEFGKLMPSFGGYLGYAYVERADGTKVIPGKELYLKLDDSIKSGPGAKINIIFSDVGHVSLGENTNLKVGSALLDQFYLAKGTLKSQVDFAKPDKFEIDTPNSKIFVRGTEYVVDYNETTGITTIYLNEGTLEINAAGKNTTLQAGNYMIIYPNKTIQILPIEYGQWDQLQDNFYEGSRAVAYTVWTIIIIELAGLVALRFWTDRKIKNLNKKDKTISKGVISLILSIIGLMLFLFPYIGIISSRIALSLARIQNANLQSKFATWGKVLGIIGIFLNAIILILLGIYFLA